MVALSDAPCGTWERGRHLPVAPASLPNCPSHPNEEVMMRTRFLTRLGAFVLQAVILFGCTDAPVAAPTAPRLAVAAATSATAARAGGGNVLPAQARPSGYSPTDMAGAMAYFSTSGNASTYYPRTPFQILYLSPPSSTSNTFVVAPGTMLFVPAFYITDSPPIVGDYPNSASGARSYAFGRSQVGLDDVAITVDGRTTTLGREYIAGPVFRPHLLDGDGSRFIQLGVFLTPLTPGRHTIAVTATADGDALLALTGGEPVTFAFGYTVIVR
jgi:hypothetical protein